MSDCRKCADFEWCVKNEDCGLFKAKPETNADHIRAMSDEELAYIIDTNWCAILCNNGVSTCNADCFTKILEWLKQEVTQ